MVRKEKIYEALMLISLLGVGGYISYKYLLPRILKKEEAPEEAHKEVVKTEVTVIVHNDLDTTAKVYVVDEYFNVPPNEKVVKVITTPGNYALKVMSPDGAYIDFGVEGYYYWSITVSVSEGQVETREYRIKWIPGYTPTPPTPSPPPPTPPPTPEKVAITFTSSPINVTVNCLYPSASGTTPLTVEVEKGKVVTYEVPREVGNYVFSSASDSVMDFTDGYVRLKTLADESKTISILYTQKTPSTPMRVYDQGAEGRIELYDIYYNVAEKKLYVDVNVVCGQTNTQTDIVGGAIIAKDSDVHGFLLGWIGCGRNLYSYTVEREWWMSYGVEIDARWRYGGSGPAIIIRNQDIRRV